MEYYRVGAPTGNARGQCTNSLPGTPEATHRWGPEDRPCATSNSSPSRTSPHTIAKRFHAYRTVPMGLALSLQHGSSFRQNLRGTTPRPRGLLRHPPNSTLSSYQHGTRIPTAPRLEGRTAAWLSFRPAT